MDHTGKQHVPICQPNMDIPVCSIVEREDANRNRAMLAAVRPIRAEPKREILSDPLNQFG